MRPLTDRELRKLNHIGKRAVYTGGIIAVNQIKALPFIKKLKFLFTK